MRDRTSYTTIPRFYDAIMAHVDYGMWAEYLQKLWKKHLPRPPRTALEIGAGTCPFARFGLYPPSMSAYFTDLSTAMLAQAPEQAPRAAANALALPFREGGFDLALMIYDAFNHLMDETGARLCLREAYRVLQPGGLFIFDITTQTNSKRHFESFLDVEELPEATYIRQSAFDAESGMQENRFVYFIHEQDGVWRRSEEIHQQRIFPVEAILQWVRETGFDLAGCYAGFSFKPGSDSSERVHIAALKPGGPG